MYIEKVICQKLVQVSSIEDYKLRFCTLLLPVTLTNKYNNLGLSNLNSLKHMDKHHLLHWGAQL